LPDAADVPATDDLIADPAGLDSLPRTERELDGIVGAENVINIERLARTSRYRGAAEPSLQPPIPVGPARHTVTLRSRGRKACLVLATDITERKNLEEQFSQVQRLESIGRLAATPAWLAS
jgi:hypothetical protein